MVKVCDMTEEEHARVLEYKRQWREKNKDKISGYQKKYHSTHKARYQMYYEANKERFFERALKSRSRYPDERKARNIVSRQVACGKLRKKPCEVCGNPKADAHHDDYNKPLDVRWLCREHHIQWHSENEPIRATHKRNCCECGHEFVYAHNREKYCSDKCKKEANKKLCHEYYLTHKEKWKRRSIYKQGRSIKMNKKYLQPLEECNKTLSKTEGINYVILVADTMNDENKASFVGGSGWHIEDEDGDSVFLSMIGGLMEQYLDEYCEKYTDKLRIVREFNRNLINNLTNNEDAHEE